MGEADQVSPNDVQPSYMSDDSETGKEQRYKNVKEMLQVAKIDMCDAKLTRS